LEFYGILWDRTESSVMSGDSSFRERSESVELKTSFDSSSESAKKLASSTLTPRKEEKQSI